MRLRNSRLLPLLLCASGCTAPLLVWQPRTPDPHVRSRVEVVVDDVRPDRRGGRDHREIGRELSAFGLPLSLRLVDELEPSRKIRVLVQGALASRGIGAPIAESFAAVRVGVEISDLWCAPDEGAFAAQGAISLHVLTMPRGEPGASERFTGRVDHQSNCAVAFRRLLDAMSNELASAFGRADLRDRLLGNLSSEPTAR